MTDAKTPDAAKHVYLDAGAWETRPGAPEEMSVGQVRHLNERTEAALNEGPDQWSIHHHPWADGDPVTWSKENDMAVEEAMDKTLADLEREDRAAEYEALRDLEAAREAEQDRGIEIGD